MRNRGLVLFCTATTVLAVAGIAAAGSISLSTASLPSSQGWSYVTAGINSGVSESSVFSASGGTLFQNTVGISYGNSGGTFYDAPLPSWFLPDDPFEIRFRVRIIEDEGLSGNVYYGYGFVVQIGTGTELFSVGMTTDRVRDANLVAHTYDNEAFHDYRLAVTPGSGYELYADGSLIGSGATRYYAQAGLRLGDGTGITNARAELRNWTLVQGASAVPLPSGAAGGAALMGLLLLMRRRFRISRRPPTSP